MGAYVLHKYTHKTKSYSVLQVNKQKQKDGSCSMFTPSW